jgi:hypothetical protein
VACSELLRRRSVAGCSSWCLRFPSFLLRPPGQWRAGPRSSSSPSSRVGVLRKLLWWRRLGHVWEEQSWRLPRVCAASSLSACAYGAMSVAVKEAMFPLIAGLPGTEADQRCRPRCPSGSRMPLAGCGKIPSRRFTHLSAVGTIRRRRRGEYQFFLCPHRRGQ